MKPNTRPLHFVSSLVTNMTTPPAVLTSHSACIPKNRRPLPPEKGPSIAARSLSLLIVISMSGCTAIQSTHQVKLDQNQMRAVLMDYTEDQIMENLIRARNGLPFVHFDFSHVTAQVTTKVTPSVAGGRTRATASNLSPNMSTTQTAAGPITTTIAAIGGVLETITRPFSYGVTAERDNVVNVEVNPVLADKNVYEAYINFLIDPWGKGSPQASTASAPAPPALTKRTVIEKTGPQTTTTTAEPKASPSDTLAVTKATTENIGGEKTTITTEEPKAPPPDKLDTITDFEGIDSLRRSPNCQPANLIVIQRLWRDHYYYYVPREYKHAFFKLCLITVARSPVKSLTGASSTPIDDPSYELRRIFMSQ